MENKKSSITKIDFQISRQPGLLQKTPGGLKEGN
jgi:hypothetical protein